MLLAKQRFLLSYLAAKVRNFENGCGVTRHVIVQMKGFG